jgi:hypothetical protein
MNADRKRFLRRSLDSQLESATAEEGTDRMARAKWLGDQLENYVERWLGFQAAPPHPSPPAEDDELFGMIEVGAELLGEELVRARAITDNQASWREFLKALNGVRTEGGSEQLRLLREAFVGLRAKLTGMSREIGEGNQE